MDLAGPAKPKPTAAFHVVAVPYPGRGHINPLMNFCNFLVSQSDSVSIDFILTAEWLNLIGSSPRPDRIRLVSIPNVLPLESDRAKDMAGFFEAMATRMRSPFEEVLDRVEMVAVDLIMGDSFLPWVVGVGDLRNIPVASFWPLSAVMFSVYWHFRLFAENGHFPADFKEIGHECVKYIPGISSIRIVDLTPLLKGTKPVILHRILEAFSWVSKARYLLFSTVRELEPHALDALNQELPIPIYTIGPTIPYYNLKDHSPNIPSNVDIGDLAHETAADISYFRWLDFQPCSSVLYISFGSYLSVSSTQMEEIAAGLHSSGVRFLWSTHDHGCRRLKEVCGDMGLIVPWCDQLRVLRHPSVGGFWTHCGWNSVQEGIFAGVPFLTSPIAADQFTNSKFVVEDCKIGWRVKEELRVEILVTREEIAGLLRRFMDLESNERQEMERRVKELQQICQRAVSKDGSSHSNIDSFLNTIQVTKDAYTTVVI